MQNFILKNGYKMRFLSEADRTAVFNLCIRADDYYQLHCGVSASDREVDEIFRNLPPGKEYKDKFVIGVFDNAGILVGVIELIRGYPTDGEWILGLMLLDPKERGRGLGKSVHSAIMSWAKSLEADSLRIGVIEENKNGQAFWTALGYKKTKEVNLALNELTHNVYVMRLPL